MLTLTWNLPYCKQQEAGRGPGNEASVVLHGVIVPLPHYPSSPLPSPTSPSPHSPPPQGKNGKQISNTCSSCVMTITVRTSSEAASRLQTYHFVSLIPR